jgi:malate dehydrogenase (oxaloacetate-decarboxylating)
MIERFTARGGQATDLAGVMAKSSMVIATTGVPGLIKPEQVRKGQVILALSNPDPEILPDDAMAFPGLFKGALRARATTINDAMKIAAAKAIAQHAMEGELMPNILDRSAHEEVARAVEATALKTGVVRFSRHLEP